MKITEVSRNCNVVPDSRHLAYVLFCWYGYKCEPEKCTKMTKGVCHSPGGVPRQSADRRPVCCRLLRAAAGHCLPPR